jgi:hypothetical protein
MNNATANIAMSLALTMAKLKKHKLGMGELRRLVHNLLGDYSNSERAAIVRFLNSAYGLIGTEPSSEAVTVLKVKR